MIRVYRTEYAQVDAERVRRSVLGRGGTIITFFSHSRTHYFDVIFSFKKAKAKAMFG
jgi:uroporphyrinogen-III synthase